MYIEVKSSSKKSLHKQLYDQLVEKILTRELIKGDKLPGSRSLALDINVSRSTVVEVYDQLISEGYIETIKGSGTYVRDLKIPNNREETEIHDRVINENNLFKFESGIPDLSKIPTKLWGKIYRSVSVECDPMRLNYGDIEGNIELRLELSKYLLRSKGIKSSANNIVIVSGTSQAIMIISKIIKSVTIEDPSVNFIKTIFRESGTIIRPIEVDKYGMKTDLLDPTSSEMILVSPSHQFPLGGCLPIDRRLELVNFANRYDKYIIEDDYDSEFRFKGTPVNSIFRLDPSRVIHIGTFSKVFSPSIRLGYMVIPNALIDRVINVKKSLNIMTPELLQLTMASFVKSGFLEGHIYKMKKLYRSKLEFFTSVLIEKFGQNIKLIGTTTGLHFVVDFSSMDIGLDEVRIRAKKIDVELSLVHDYSISPNKREKMIILGFANLTLEQINKGVKYLVRILS